MARLLLLSIDTIYPNYIFCRTKTYRFQGVVMQFYIPHETPKTPQNDDFK